MTEKSQVLSQKKDIVELSSQATGTSIQQDKHTCLPYKYYK